MYRSGIVFVFLAGLLAAWSWGQSKPAPANSDRAAAQRELTEWKQNVAATLKRQIADDVQAEMRASKSQMAADLRQQIKGELRQELASELRQQLKAELKMELRQELKSEIKTELQQEFRRP